LTLGKNGKINLNKMTETRTRLTISIVASLFITTMALQQIRIYSITKKLEKMEREKVEDQKKIEDLEEKVFLLEAGNRILRSAVDDINKR
jgi:cell division protein FtsL